MSQIWWIAPLAILIILPYSLLLLIYLRIKKFEKAHKSLAILMSGQSLDKMLDQNTDELERLRTSVNQTNHRLQIIEAKSRSAVDRAELLRFNAFDNMGSDLSFALALLNQEGDGVVISSINSREDSRVYAKPISSGKSKYHISAEENIVIEKALKAQKV